MNGLKRFMAGRHGGDQLSVFLLVLSMVLTLIGQLAEISAIFIISYIPLLAAFYRIFSKDIQRRRMENYRFAMLVSPVYSKLKKAQRRIKDLKTHRYYKCSKCKTMLRVPRGKGKILITCPKCKEKFTRRT